MASKVKKGLLYYLLWVFLILFGIVCIFASVLLFNKNKDVFGIGLKYVSYLDSDTVNTMMIEGDERTFTGLDIEKFNFNSTYADFTVVIDPVFTQITFIIDKKVNGFSNDKENNGCYLDFNYENKELSVNVVAPTFWLGLGTNIDVVMYVPKTYSLVEKEFNFTTENGNIIPAGRDTVADISMAKLNIVTNLGQVKLFDRLKVETGEVNIECKKSYVYVYSDIKTQLNFKSETGKLYVESISGNLNIESIKLDVKCDFIGGNVWYSSKSGYIRINKLGTNSSNGNFSAEIDKMHIADVIINEMTGDLDIPNAEKSNITVTKLGGEALVETTSGNIKIEQAQKNVTLKTLYGSIFVTQIGISSKTDLQTTSGKITANFTKIEKSEIKSERGLVEINIATDLQFVFNYSTEKEITVSWIRERLDKDGTIYIGGATESTTSMIDVVTGGRIELIDGYGL